MANLKDVIYLSNADYYTLATTGTVTIGSDTLTYSTDNVYITPDILASSTEDGLMSSSDKIKLDGINLNNYLPLTGGTLTGDLTLNNNIGIKGLDTSSTSRNIIQSTSNDYIYLGGSGWNGIYSYNRIIPGATNTYALGTSSLQWSAIYGNTIYENGTSLSSKYLALTGGTLSGSTAPILTLKRTDANSGAYLTFKNSNQDTNYWRIGMVADNNFAYNYKGTDLLIITTSGTIKNGSTNYGLALPTMTSWTANKTIATTDQIPNTFTGTAATISVSGTPSGSVTLNGDASSGVSYISSVSGGTGTTKYFHPSFSNGSASATSSTATTVASSTHTHALTASGSVSLTANAESATGRITYLQDVTHTAATLTGTTTFNTDAIKSVALSASTTSTDGPTYIESVTGASGTTNYLHFTAGTTPPSSASPSHTSTDTAATTASGVSVVTGITAGSGSLTSNDTASGGIAYIASASHTAASLGTASTGTVTISNGSYSISASRSTSGSGTSARRTLTVSLSGSAPSLGGTTTFVTGYPSFSGGSASHTTKYLHHTHTSASASGTGTAAVNTHTHKYDKTTSVSLTTGTAPSLTLNTTSSGGLGVIVSVSGGTGTTKYMKVTTSAASTGTVGISGGSISKTTKYLSAGFTGSSATTSSISGTTNVASTSHTHSVTGTVSLGSNTTSTDGVAYTESVTAASGTSKKLSASFSGSSTTSTGSYTPAGSISHS